MTTDIISTECCNVQIHSDQRYCPKCGYEARIHTRKTEGDKCTYSDCDGMFEYIREGQCSCHISPPCSSCVDAPLVCNKCGEYADEDNGTGFGLYDDYLMKVDYPTHYKLLSPMTPTEQSNASPKAPGTEISPNII